MIEKDGRPHQAVYPYGSSHSEYWSVLRIGTVQLHLINQFDIVVLCILWKTHVRMFYTCTRSLHIMTVNRLMYAYVYHTLVHLYSEYAP